MIGQRSTAGRRRIRSVLVVGLLGLGAMGIVGTASADDAELVDGTPCSTQARACVDIDGGNAWLIADGAVVLGPVTISSGGPGRETPRGDFRVEWKDSTHRSAEFNNAPMPYSVFFAPGGIAFHEGSIETPSAGCVRLFMDDARAFYNFLAVGDNVEVR